MAENSTKQHYENLLAKHYSWMFGDFDQQVKKNIDWFESHNIHPKNNKKAIDFGCGSGFQSLALSSLGFSVTAIDFNKELLDELKAHYEKDAVDVIQSDILEVDNYSQQAPFELAVCMGDTLPHLPSEQKVSRFFDIAFDLLDTRGTLILSFRDLSAELTGTDRFIPVQSEEDKIMTVFLEYTPDFVFVHDLVYEQKDGSWKLEKSMYKKIRLSADKVKNLLDKANFRIEHLQSDKGMIHIVANKR